MLKENDFETYYCNTNHESNSIKIDSIEKLPIFIQNNIQQIFDISLTDFKPNIQFNEGKINDSENEITDTSEFNSRYKNDYIRPKYDLYFTLNHRITNNKNYCLNIEFDQVGQLISINWPRTNYNSQIDFLPIEKIIDIAKSYARKHLLKSKNYKIVLDFDRQTNTLYWNVWFLQKSIGSKNSFSKKYKVLSIDPISGIIITISEGMSCSYACGGF